MTLNTYSTPGTDPRIRALKLTRNMVELRVTVTSVNQRVSPALQGQTSLYVYPG
jgi:hypothetical protein